MNHVLIESIAIGLLVGIYRVTQGFSAEIGIVSGFTVAIASLIVLSIYDRHKTKKK